MENNLMPPYGYNEQTSVPAVKSISNLFSKLFESRNFAHYAHLQAKSKSYSQHKALGSFYESIADISDSFFEIHAGQYGPTKFNISSVNTDQEVVSYFENLGKFFIDSHSMVSKKDTHLHNIIDEITALTFHLLYKLKNLK